MPCTITLLDEDTGETRDIAEPRDWWADDGACEFHWTEGGYACCNRAGFFYPDGSVTVDCRSNRFTITKVAHSDGSVDEVEFTRAEMAARPA